MNDGPLLREGLIPKGKTSEIVYWQDNKTWGPDWGPDVDISSKLDESKRRLAGNHKDRSRLLRNN